MVPVQMNDGKYSTEGLTTFGINGCIALISRTKNGRNRHGILTHYGPTKIELNLKKLSELLELYSDDLEHGDTKAAIFYPKIGEPIEELARKVKEGFERLSRKGGIVKMIPYPIEQEYLFFTGIEGTLKFDVVSGRYDFQPFTYREGYNPAFHSFL